MLTSMGLLCTWIQPVAGADEFRARGTHAALEERFHSEVSLPKGYQIGDWEAGCLSVSSPGLAEQLVVCWFYMF